MLFNSYSFLFVFAPIVYFIYWKARTPDQKKVVSVLASYVFYGVWSWKFAALMLATTSVDYFTAKRIEDTQNRRLWLTVSMIANLGVLAIFKYYDFFVGNLNELFPRPLLPLLSVALPIGISFYTFESMSYTIDVYRGHTTALRRFIDYAHFVTMFPRLVAGPIVRYTDMAEQLRNAPSRLSPDTVMEALHFFTIGMIKKVLIADFLARELVDPLFAQTHQLEAISAWTAALAYTGQLYFDFSGYSDMAVGLALLLGFRLPRNFNLPYAAANPSEFWRRWHISLSTWLRDYLYIPLGGNRGGRWATYKNLFLTMLLGGLWHGANWTFIFWGALHGAWLVVHHALSGTKPWPRPIGVALTLLTVVIGWVMFRAASVDEALAVYGAMAGGSGLGIGWLAANPSAALVPFALMLAIRIDTYDVPMPRIVGWAIVEAILLVVCISRLWIESPFLYFQF